MDSHDCTSVEEGARCFNQAENMSWGAAPSQIATLFHIGNHGCDCVLLALKKKSHKCGSEISFAVINEFRVSNKALSAADIAF